MFVVGLCWYVFNHLSVLSLLASYLVSFVLLLYHSFSTIRPVILALFFRIYDLVLVDFFCVFARQSVMWYLSEFWWARLVLPAWLDVIEVRRCSSWIGFLLLLPSSPFLWFWLGLETLRFREPFCFGCGQEGSRLTSHLMLLAEARREKWPLKKGSFTERISRSCSSIQIAYQFFVVWRELGARWQCSKSRIVSSGG